jgi:uncharacterized protein with NAD-binding domain and iron-sulfur cluster
MQRRVLPIQHEMRVAVFGGGIAGLTAAHELASAGLTVTLYEPTAPIPELGPWTAIGGKARSQYYRATETGTLYLPGEHGFRFFPSFYANTFDTLDRIPIPRVEGARSRGTVFDRLKPARRWGAAYGDGRLLALERRRPGSPQEVMALVRFLLGPGFSVGDSAVLLTGLGRASMLVARGREQELDETSFWSLMRADRLSQRSQRFLRTMPRALVGMEPCQGSARTMLYALWRLAADQARRAPGDFVLSGPTSEAWFRPWFEQLERQGVRFAVGPRHRVVALEVAAGRLQGARLADGQLVVADHHVLALPLRRARDLLQSCGARDHTLGAVDVDAAEGWMVGAQVFVRRHPPAFDGHIVFPDSPWCVSAIAQHVYWSPSEAHFRRVYGGGRFAGVLSLIFSAPDRAGLLGRPALGAPREAVWRELAHVLAGARGADGETWLDPEDLATWHLDDDILVGGSDEVLIGQASPLLVHPPGLYATRPGAESGLSGLSLAGDYLRTSVDLATMEGANESGRMAARHTLERLGLSGEAVALFEHHSPRASLLRAFHGGTEPVIPDVHRRPAGVLTRRDIVSEEMQHCRQAS